MPVVYSNSCLSFFVGRAVYPYIVTTVVSIGSIVDKKNKISYGFYSCLHNNIGSTYDVVDQRLMADRRKLKANTILEQNYT